jgi:hypothetical protein
MLWRLASLLAWITMRLALALETITDRLLAYAKRRQRRARRA